MSAAVRLFRALDVFVILLLGTLVVATLLPPSPMVLALLGEVRGYVIALVFWAAGVRISPRASWDGLRAWRLHAVVLATTFVALPLLAAGVAGAFSGMLSADLGRGLLFLGALPSVVQSSVAFVSMARGNVAAAVCTASLSSIVGVVATPLVAFTLIGSGVGLGPDLFIQLAVQVLLPFAAGQMLHRWLSDWAVRNSPLLRWLDRTAILMIVYGAFGGAVAAGVWQRLPEGQLIGLIAACLVLLGAAMSMSALLGRVFGFEMDDQVVVFLCGSAKSLTIGLPMSALLFDGALAGIVILPVIVYHQGQLIAATLLARAYGRRSAAETADRVAAAEAP